MKQTWPGLDKELGRKHLLKIINTTKGHFYQEQKIRSTKSPNKKLDHNIWARMQELLRKKKEGQALEDILNKDISQDDLPPSPASNTKTNEVMYHVYTPELTGKLYLNLIGNFLYRSSQGNEYILVGYYFDGNAILATRTKNRQAKIIKEAWEMQHRNFIVA